MGSSHIQPAWESNNNNKKKVEERGGKRHCCSRFSPPEPTVRRARGESRGGRCGARRGQRAQFPAGVGRPRRFLRCRAAVRTGERRGGGAAGGGGLRSLRRLLRYLCGPRPASDRGAGSRGSFLGSPRIRLHLLRRVLNRVSVRVSVPAAGPSARRPWGSRILFL